MTTSRRTQLIRPMPEFDGMHDTWPRGGRLRAVREAAGKYRERFITQGQAKAIKSLDVAAPYPARFAFQNYSVNMCRRSVKHAALAGTPLFEENYTTLGSRPGRLPYTHP